MKTIPARKLQGRVSRVLKATGRDFVSRPVDELELTYGGIKDDYHEGLTRNSGGREPWYPRGTEMRNERHLSILSEEEIKEMAERLSIEELKPDWIGANLVFEGIPNLSLLPPRTLLFFDGGVTLRVDGYNAPCRSSGGSIAQHLGKGGENPSKTQLAIDFVEAGRLKRGIVAWVEREGTIKPGEGFTARIWEQWLYE